MDMPIIFSIFPVRLSVSLSLIYVADCDVKGAAQADPALASALSGLSGHVKIVPMHDAEPGTCIVEMPDEIIDASASTQLDNIRAIVRENA